MNKIERIRSVGSIYRYFTHELKKNGISFRGTMVRRGEYVAHVYGREIILKFGKDAPGRFYMVDQNEAENMIVVNLQNYQHVLYWLISRKKDNKEKKNVI